MRGRDLAADPRDEHCQQPGAECGDHEYECPLHSMTLAVQRPTDLGCKLLVPVAALEEKVEVEQIVGSERRSDASLGELGRESPLIEPAVSNRCARGVHLVQLGRAARHLRWLARARALLRGGA